MRDSEIWGRHVTELTRQMRVEAVRATHQLAAARVCENREVGRQPFARRGRMPQVKRDATEQQALSANAGMLQPQAQLLVLRPPADELLVEAVDAHQIVAPEALVAALDGKQAVAGQ